MAIHLWLFGTVYFGRPYIFSWTVRGSPFFGPEKCLKEFILTWWACFENPILVHSVFSSKCMIMCPKPILVHFSIIRNSDFAPISIRSKNLDQNRKFELLKMDQNRIWTRDHTFRRENWVDQNRIFEASSSRENELLQTLFWTKKGTPAYMTIFKEEVLNDEIFRKQSFLSKTYVAWLQFYNYMQHDFLRWSDLHIYFMSLDRKTSYGHKMSVQWFFRRNENMLMHAACNMQWMNGFSRI